MRLKDVLPAEKYIIDESFIGENLRSIGAFIWARDSDTPSIDIVLGETIQHCMRINRLYAESTYVHVL